MQLARILTAFRAASWRQDGSSGGEPAEHGVTADGRGPLAAQQMTGPLTGAEREVFFAALRRKAEQRAAEFR
jgi:hypothetical protein